MRQRTKQIAVAAILPLLILTLSSCTGSRFLNGNSEGTHGGMASGASFVNYTEYDERGYTVPVPARWQNPVVDYRSRLEVDVSTDELKRLVAGKEGLSPLTPAERERIEGLRKISADLDDFVAMKKKHAQLMEKYYSPNISQKDKVELRSAMVDAIKDEARVLFPLKKTLGKQIEMNVKQTEPPGAGRIEKINEMRSSLVHCGGDSCTLNTEATSKLINAEIGMLRDLMERDAAAVGRLRKIDIGMGAILYGKETDPQPVHVENYDNIEAGYITKRERMAYALGEADRERLMKEYETAAAMANSINAAGGLIDYIKGGVSAYINGEEIRNLEAAIEGLGNIGALITKVGDDQALQEVKTHLEALKVSIEGITNLIESAKGFLNASDPGMVLDAYSALATATARQDSTTAIKAFGESASAVQKDMENEKVLSAIWGGLADEANVNLGVLAKFDPDTMLIAMGIALGGRTAAEIAAKLNEIKADRTGAILHSADAAPSGVIDLSRTVADRSDRLLVTVTLANTPASSGSFSREQERSFRIDRTGWTSDFNASLIFVDRDGSGNEGDPEVSYKAAPSVSWGLHYRLRPQTPPDGESAFLWSVWRGLDPGFAVSAASLDFENESMQIGIGGQVSLFNELLILGYGYNLHAETDRRYVYVGIGLLGPLSNLTNRSLTE